MTETTAAAFHAGIIAVVGRPNVGKSTLVNALVRARVAITSPMPQTTRGRIFGIRTTPYYQLVFADTPGYHKSTNMLGRAMSNVVRDETAGADVNAFVVDLQQAPTQEDKRLAKVLFGSQNRPGAPVVLVGNKVDLIPPERAQANLTEFQALGSFHSSHLVSAAIGSGLPQLEEALAALVPESPMLFPADTHTDQDRYTEAAELIREKALQLTRQEVPHAIAVEVEEIREGKTPDTVYVQAIIYVEKDTQKAIIVGKGGERLKKIGTMARKDLQGVWGEKVFLDLWVKVKEDWRQRPDVLRAWGYNV
jgi:GTP-binding protein Era